MRAYSLFCLVLVRDYLGLSSGKDSSSKICLNNKGSLCFDDKTDAETFKAFFSNLASDLVKKTPAVSSQAR